MIQETINSDQLPESLKFDNGIQGYRCECKGALPRLRHAVISTLTARRGRDGQGVLSFPALVAPYAGTMIAVRAWYPSRYRTEDALRMGNYTMLGYVGGNIALEFLYSGPTRCFIACISTMVAERRVRLQVRDRPEIGSVAGLPGARLPDLDDAIPISQRISNAT